MKLQLLSILILFYASTHVCNGAVIEGEAASRSQRNAPQDGNGSNVANSHAYIEILRGRDGRDGRDGVTGEPGPRGLHGPQGERGPPGPRSGGVVYTRWGRTTCPSTTGTELLYRGITAGSWYSHTGGGANYLCLPRDPEYLSFRAAAHSSWTWRSYLYGTEYQVASGDPLPNSVNDHDAPCAVCFASSQAAVVMIPAKTTCPSSWRVEYVGYLMANYHTSNHYRTTYECVDRDPESISGSAPDTNGALFYLVEATCTGIPCPPYDSRKEIMCVMCTK